MTDSELTVANLRDIRDEIRDTKTTLSARLALLDTSVSSRINSVENSLSTRLDETNTRLGVIEHTVRDASEQLVLLTRYVKNTGRRHDEEIDDLRDRVARLEGQPAK